MATPRSRDDTRTSTDDSTASTSEQRLHVPTVDQFVEDSPVFTTYVDQQQRYQNYLRQQYGDKRQAQIGHANVPYSYDDTFDTTVYGNDAVDFGANLTNASHERSLSLFHNLALASHVYTNSSVNEKVVIMDTVLSRAEDSELRFLSGDSKRLTKPNVIRFFCYGAALNVDRIKSDYIARMAQLGVVGLIRTNVQDATMIRLLDLWYLVLNENQCEFAANGITLNDVENALMNGDGINCRMCSICAKAFVNFNSKGINAKLAAEIQAYQEHSRSENTTNNGANYDTKTNTGTNNDDETATKSFNVNRDANNGNKNVNENETVANAGSTRTSTVELSSSSYSRDPRIAAARKRAQSVPMVETATATKRKNGSTATTNATATKRSSKQKKQPLLSNGANLERVIVETASKINENKLDIGTVSNASNTDNGSLSFATVGFDGFNRNVDTDSCFAASNASSNGNAEPSSLESVVPSTMIDPKLLKPNESGMRLLREMDEFARREHERSDAQLINSKHSCDNAATDNLASSGIALSMPVKPSDLENMSVEEHLSRLRRDGTLAAQYLLNESETLETRIDNETGVHSGNENASMPLLFNAENNLYVSRGNVDATGDGKNKSSYVNNNNNGETSDDDDNDDGDDDDESSNDSFASLERAAAQLRRNLNNDTRSLDGGDNGTVLSKN